MYIEYCSRILGIFFSCIWIHPRYIAIILLELYVQAAFFFFGTANQFEQMGEWLATSTKMRKKNYNGPYKLFCCGLESFVVMDGKSSINIVVKASFVLGESHCGIRKTGRTQPLVKKTLLRTFIILLTYNIRQYTFVNQHHREERPKTIWNIYISFRVHREKKNFSDSHTLSCYFSCFDA